jgi:predicted RNase H-like nuclease (RuvC/YqgF family)
MILFIGIYTLIVLCLLGILKYQNYNLKREMVSLRKNLVEHKNTIIELERYIKESNSISTYDSELQKKVFELQNANEVALNRIKLLEKELEKNMSLYELE